MRLYYAGYVKPSKFAPEPDRNDYRTGVRNRLLSYADIIGGAHSFRYWVQDQDMPEGARVFLDSGAFSVWRNGATIKLDEYCAFVESHSHRLVAHAVLDVIGDWRKSARNFDIMRRRGLEPVPIFHLGQESYDVLDGILSERPAYIGVGGMASGRPSYDIMRRLLDGTWRVIERHWPIRVHGFGISMLQWALERYPWHSVDGTTAIMFAVNGKVLRYANGRIESYVWRDYLRRTLDGVPADGIGRPGGSAHDGRRRRNIEAYLALEQYVTDLWLLKGVDTERPA